MSQYLQKSKLFLRTDKDLPNFERQKLETHRKIVLTAHFMYFIKIDMEWKTPKKKKKYFQKVS